MRVCRTVSIQSVVSFSIRDTRADPSRLYKRAEAPKFFLWFFLDYRLIFAVPDPFAAYWTITLASAVKFTHLSLTDPISCLNTHTKTLFPTSVWTEDWRFLLAAPAE